MAQYRDEPLPLIVGGTEEAVTVGMLVWRMHRTLTTVRTLILDAVGADGGGDDMVRCLLETTVRAREIAEDLLDAVNTSGDWGEPTYRLVDGVTAVVGLASYLRVRRRRPLPNILQVWHTIESTLDVSRELTRRARGISLEARILLSVDSALYSSPRLPRFVPPRRSRRVSMGDL